MKTDRWSSADREQLRTKGITVEQLEVQLKRFKTGFPYLELETPASALRGILVPDVQDIAHYIAVWEEFLQQSNKTVQKFVPASGAASRMFKELFAFIEADYDEPTTNAECAFFDRITDFAFYNDLDAICIKNQGQSVLELLAGKRFKRVVKNLLLPEGMNYGQLPKGLLKFHSQMRTPVEEHLMEAILYATIGQKTTVHFTVSNEHRALFEQLVTEKLTSIEHETGIRVQVSFSEQKSCTDTIAVTSTNEPFREEGKMVFRPGGHGALIENLNDLNADIVFIKNIDNVVPDRLKADTVTYKKMLAGILITLQQQMHSYLRVLDSGLYSHADLEEIIRFVQQQLHCRLVGIKDLEDAELVIYLRRKLDRPIRVCGMVKNIGEPGGGPFLAHNEDGTVSPQILESSQIDASNPEYVKMFSEGTHFNPVDLVCAITDRNGRHYDLRCYVDQHTGFISHKSKSGRELKALELPGLWNGAMSNWNTVFVEVPLSTFNPVKTVNDLLRDEHQG